MVEFLGTSRVNANAVSAYTVEFRERSGWDQGLNSSAVILHEIRSDGLVRFLTNNPIGTILASGEFVLPSPSTVVRVESIDPASHTAQSRIWRLPASGIRNVRIFTILFDPRGPEPQGEFVLIQNDRAVAADLAGWSLLDAAQHVYTFPIFTLPAGGAVKVWTGTGTNNTENLYWGRRQAVWNNTGDSGILRDVAGTEITSASLFSNVVSSTQLQTRHARRLDMDYRYHRGTKYRRTDLVDALLCIVVDVHYR